MTEKYVLEVDIDHETGEEHCTVLKTDETTNMTNWIEIYSAMYIHHSILEPLVDELNKLQNNYDNNEKYAIELSKENEQLKADNNRLVNETAKVVAEHQGRVLDLIDKRIDKCEPIDYARNIEGDVPVFDCETATEIRVLNELKMELFE